MDTSEQVEVQVNRDDFAKLMSSLENLEKEVAELRSQGTVKELRIEAMKTANAAVGDHQRTIEKQHRRLVESEKENEVLTMVVESLQSTVKNQSKGLKELGLALMQDKDASSRLIETLITSHECVLQSRSDRYIVLKRQLDSEKQRKDELQDLNKHLQVEIRYHRGRTHDLKRQLAQVKEESLRHESIDHENRQRVKDLQSQMNGIKEQLARTSRESPESLQIEKRQTTTDRLSDIQDRQSKRKILSDSDDDEGITRGDSAVHVSQKRMKMADEGALGH